MVAIILSRAKSTLEQSVFQLIASNAKKHTGPNTKAWAEQKERQKAYDLLFPVYDWFSEGFDTADLQ